MLCLPQFFTQALPLRWRGLLALFGGAALHVGCDAPGAGLPTLAVGTIPQTEDSLRSEVATVGLIADVQYCDCAPEGGRFFRESLRKMSGAVHTMNTELVDLTVLLGDLIERDFESFAPIMAGVQRLDAPVYPVLGNHEYEVDEADRGSVLAAMGMEGRYSETSVGLWRFIMLDGNDLSLYATLPGSPRRLEAEAMYDSLRAVYAQNAQPWSGGIGDEQLRWLRATLDDASAQGQRVALFSHFPVYPASIFNLWNDREILDLVESYSNVVAHFSGHDHGGRFETRARIHHIGIAAMVETERTTAYALVHFRRDEMEVVGHGRVPSRTLMYRPDRPLEKALLSRSRAHEGHAASPPRTNTSRWSERHARGSGCRAMRLWRRPASCRRVACRYLPRSSPAPTMLLVLLVIAHILFAATWFGLGVALTPLSRAVASGPSEGLLGAGNRVVQGMTGSVILWYVLALAAFFVGGGFSSYGPTYHTSLLLGLALVLLQVLVVQPAWQKLASGDASARKRVAMGTGIGHGLWLVMLILMFFGPRWASTWGF